MGNVHASYIPYDHVSRSEMHISGIPSENKAKSTEFCYIYMYFNV
jgi:hypothetical protein